MAISFKKFVSRLSRGAAVLGVALSLSTAAEAANSTWTGATNNKWGTGFATNWSAGLPGTGDIASFGAVANPTNYFVQLSNTGTAAGSAYQVNGMAFTGDATAAYYFLNSNVVNIGTQGIVNNNPDTDGVNLTNVRLVSGGTPGTRSFSGSGNLTISQLDLGLKSLNLSSSGTTTITSMLNTGVTPGNTINVTAGVVNIASGVASPDVEVSGGVLNMGDSAGLNTSSTTLSVSGGVFNNGGFARVFTNGGSGDAVNMSSGTINLTTTGDKLDLTGDYTQTAGEIQMAVASLASFSQVEATGAANFGGDMYLDLTTLGAVSQGNSWLLFDANTYSGQQDGTGNFANVTSNPTTGLYAGLTWTQYGQEWRSSTFSATEYFVFRSQNGTLVVVPEPSTYAMGAVGIAMAGLARWHRSRRKAAAA